VYWFRAFIHLDPRRQTSKYLNKRTVLDYTNKFNPSISRWNMENIEMLKLHLFFRRRVYALEDELCYSSRNNELDEISNKKVILVARWIDILNYIHGVIVLWRTSFVIHQGIMNLKMNWYSKLQSWIDCALEDELCYSSRNNESDEISNSKKVIWL